MAAIQRARDRIRDVGRKVLIDTSAFKLSRLISRVHRYVLQHGIRGVVIDYGQLIEDDTAGRHLSKTEEVMRVARAARNRIAHPLNVPVWLLAQANREVEKRKKDNRPATLTMSDLGWSNELEAVAYQIVFLNPNPDRFQHDTDTLKHVLVDVHKNKNGTTGLVPLVFNKPRFRFAAEAGAEPIDSQAFQARERQVWGDDDE
jgi:replicative DNA helicase